MYGGFEGHGWMPFLPMLLISLPFAIGNYHLAQRLDRGPWQWAVLTLVPVVNYFFMVYVVYTVVCAILDRLAPRAPVPE